MRFITQNNLQWTLLTKYLNSTLLGWQQSNTYIWRRSLSWRCGGIFCEKEKLFIWEFIWFNKRCIERCWQCHCKFWITNRKTTRYTTWHHEASLSFDKSRCYSVFEVKFTAWKVSKYGVIFGPYFPVFSPNTGKYRPEITLYSETFYTVVDITKISLHGKCQN